MIPNLFVFDTGWIILEHVASVPDNWPTTAPAPFAFCKVRPAVEFNFPSIRRACISSKLASLELRKTSSCFFSMASHTNTEKHPSHRFHTRNPPSTIEDTYVPSGTCQEPSQYFPKNNALVVQLLCFRAESVFVQNVLWILQNPPKTLPGKSRNVLGTCPEFIPKVPWSF